MSLKERAGELISGRLNRAVALDPDARKRLRKLEGKRLSVELIGPDVTFSLGVEHGQFALGPSDPENADAIIRATPGAFLALAGSGGRAAAGQIELAGDTESARRFQAFFQELRPDMEEGFAQIFGDVVGVQLSRAVNKGLGWARFASGRMAEDLSEYFREESGQLVNEPEMEEYLDEVDDVRDHLARVEQRIMKLEKGR